MRFSGALEGQIRIVYTEIMNPDFMVEAARIALENVQSGAGGPFGAVVVKDGQIVARGRNSVTSSNDPTSCEPCPMCLGAIYWARLNKVYYGCTQGDAAAIGFDDQFIYEEIARAKGERKLEFVELGREDSLKAFEAWSEAQDKIRY